MLHVPAISRRHCVITVHATGGCELYDTASRNGTCVNGRKVRRADLLPGNVIRLCERRFLLAWVGPGGDTMPKGDWSASSECQVIGPS